jgi:hypothetical protein
MARTTTNIENSILKEVKNLQKEDGRSKGTSAFSSRRGTLIRAIPSGKGETLAMKRKK